MSGGSYNYSYRHVDDFAEALETQSQSPLRLAFAALLRKVARAMHDIEWVDSCDYGTGDDEAAILACVTTADIRQAAILDLERAIARAQRVLRGEAK